MYMYNTDPQELVCAVRYGNLEQVKRCLSDSLEDCLESHCTFDVMMKNTDSLLLEQVPTIHTYASEAGSENKTLFRNWESPT
jgi:hypothetical protein